MDQAIITRAILVGRDAFLRDEPRIAWYNAIVHEIVTDLGLAVGKGAVEIFNAFYKGYDDACDEVANKLLAA